tara:strand:+ start:84 stop:254 length:171 start_codon:yes stop_codon:yes gene_type:complete
MKRELGPGGSGEPRLTNFTIFFNSKFLKFVKKPGKIFEISYFTFEKNAKMRDPTYM